MSANYFISLSLKSFIDKSGFSKIEICVSYNSKRIYLQTPIKAKPEHFKDGKIIGGENRLQKNAVLNQQVSNIEGLILEFARNESGDINDLRDLLKPKTNTIKKQLIHNYIEYLEGFLKGKLSDGRLRHYGVIRRFFLANYPNLSFKDVTVKLLNEIEYEFRKQKLDTNTILSKMSLIISIMHKARVDKLINRDQFEDYKRPKAFEKIPEYLTIEEIEKLEAIVFAIENKTLKISGFYFLLSCYTGYRISDCQTFDYNSAVKDNMLIIRAQKNKNIISIPIHAKLEAIIKYVQNNPCTLAEPTIRKGVKQLCALVGITRNIKFHTARHSFAMMLMKKDFSIDEVAHLLGDSIDVAKIYARIHNENLNKKILDRF